MGTPLLLEAEGVKISNDQRGALNTLEGEAKTAMFVAVNRKVEGILALADTVRPDSRRAVAALKKMGMIPVMITGDNERTGELLRLGRLLCPGGRSVLGTVFSLVLRGIRIPGSRYRLGSCR